MVTEGHVLVLTHLSKGNQDNYVVHGLGEHGDGIDMFGYVKVKIIRL